MAITYFKNNSSGGSTSAPSGPIDFLEVDNTDVVLTRDDQYVAISSETAPASITFPLTSDIEDGHFIVILRRDGVNRQQLLSTDATIERTPLVSNTPRLELLLNGDIVDTSPSAATFTSTPDTLFTNTTFFGGQVHDGLEIPAGTTGISGLTSNTAPISGSQARTVYFQFIYNATPLPEDGAGFFGFGDTSSAGSLYALETDGTTGSLKLNLNNVQVNYPAGNIPVNIFDGNVHTIVVTSNSDDPNSVQLYIDDFTTAIPVGSITGTGSINTDISETTIGYSVSSDRCVTGIYSNFEVYDVVLSSDQLNILRTQGVLAGSNITILPSHTEIRFVYEQAGNIWQPSDGILLRQLQDNIRITELEEVARGVVRNGFADYSDSLTSTTPINLVPDVWTTITNNGNGPFTNLSYLPTRASRLMNTGTGQFLFDELDLGDLVFIRNDISVNPATNNALLETRYVLGTGAGEYVLSSAVTRLDSGSGKDYSFNLGPDFIYIGDTNTRDNPVTFQIRLSTNGTVVNRGSAIGVTKRGG